MGDGLDIRCSFCRLLRFLFLDICVFVHECLKVGLNFLCYGEIY